MKTEQCAESFTREIGDPITAHLALLVAFRMQVVRDARCLLKAGVINDPSPDKPGYHITHGLHVCGLSWKDIKKGKE